MTNCWFIALICHPGRSEAQSRDPAKGTTQFQTEPLPKPTTGFNQGLRRGTLPPMVRISFSDRVRLAARHAEGLGRRATAHVLGSQLAHWRTKLSAARQLVIVPQELRSADPSFWPEVEGGHFGLRSAVVELDGRSPFNVVPPNVAFARELHGFSWLRHLEAAGERGAEAAARGFLAGWLEHNRNGRDTAAQPAVRARRIISWISHAPLLLDGATAAEFDRFALALAHDVRRLNTSWRSGSEGQGRLLALTALAMARTAIDGADRHLPAALERLDAEISRQILPDGGHISRNPAVLVELLLDWLPLKSCLEARRIEPSTGLLQAIHRMLAMLRFLRLGDGAIARFNGMGVGDPAALATLLAYDDGPLPPFAIAPSARYARLSRHDLTLVADVGPPPPLATSTSAHAGCLSIEVCAGGQLLLCNAGAPGFPDAAWRSVARATASHSTVCLGESSSSRLVRHRRIEARLGAVPLQWPALVTAEVADEDGAAVLRASHDGYLERLGLVHHRLVQISADGTALHGLERLETKGGQDRLKRDVPYAVHFHLHPESECRHPAQGEIPPPPTRQPAAAGTSVIIQLRDGQSWLFQASATRVDIEESVFFAESSGPRSSLQIVVRGATGGITEVSWSVTRMR